MEMFQQLDDVKVSVSSAIDGQYYHTSCDYEQSDIVQGPSLDEILETKSGMDFEEKDIVTHTDVAVQTMHDC